MALALQGAITKPFPVASKVTCESPVEYSSLVLLNGLEGFMTGSASVPYTAAQSQGSFLPYTPLPVFQSSQFSTSLPCQKSVHSSEGFITTPPIGSTSHTSSSKNKMGRAYNPGRPLAMADRQRILHLYEKGHKISHIARIIGVTHSCVSKIMTRYRRTGSMHPRSTCNARARNTEGFGEGCDGDKGACEADIDKGVSEAADGPPDVFIHRPFAIKSYSIQSLLYEA